jgi:hypothetical protein
MPSSSPIKDGKAPEALRLILARLEAGNAGSRSPRGLQLLSVTALAALPLFSLGLIPAGPAAGVMLLGWLGLSQGRTVSVPLHGAVGRRLARTGLHGLDTLLILAAGAACRLYAGLPPGVLLWTAAAACTNYLGYYSGISLLKAVPARVRTAHAPALVKADHLFLSHGSFWGGEREIVLTCTALGLIAGQPVWGLAAAVVLGNLNWLVKSAIFWREAGQR